MLVPPLLFWRNGADRAGHPTGVAGEDGAGFVGDPGFDGRGALGVEAPSRFPEVFQHVNEVDHDGDWHAALGCFGSDPVDLVVVALDQRDQARACSGCRRWASSKIRPTTPAEPSTMLARLLRRHRRGDHPHQRSAVGQPAGRRARGATPRSRPAGAAPGSAALVAGSSPPRPGAQCGTPAILEKPLSGALLPFTAASAPTAWQEVPQHHQDQ